VGGDVVEDGIAHRAVRDHVDRDRPLFLSVHEAPRCR
jgi:hypothetical protein